VELWQPAHGGHVGFPAGAPPGHVLAMPQAVAAWLAQ
jgi:predicted alpha/beta-fold hydrolase